MENSGAKSPGRSTVLGADALFAGPGEMRALCRSFDWGGTPLRSVEQWPPALRVITGLVLASPLAMIVLWGPQLIQIYNDRYREVMGTKHPAGLGQPTSECWPEVWDFNAPLYEGVMQRGESYTFNDHPLVIKRHGAPEKAFFTFTFSPASVEAGGALTAAGVLVTLTETTEHKRTQTQLQALNATLEQQVIEHERSRKVLQTVADHLPAMVALVDDRLHYCFVNETYQRRRAAHEESLVGRSIAQVLGAQRFGVLKPYLQRALQGERVTFEQTMRVEGAEHYVEVNYVPQRDAEGRPDGFMVLVYDITERKQLELRLAREASHDGLTGLPNRRQLMECLSQAVLRAQRQGQSLALLFMDLDGFKEVNDTHGHDAGDQLLQAVAQRLRQSVRRTDTVARLAGDEFVIVLEGVQSDLEQLVTKMHTTLAAPVMLPDGVEVRVGASIGVACYAGEKDTSAQALLSLADASMYEAKRSKRSGAAADQRPWAGAYRTTW